MKFAVILLVFVLTMGIAQANEEAVSSESPWSGKAELGIVNSSGNTETSSSNGKLLIDFEEETWKQEFRLETFQAESEVIDNGAKVTQSTADRTYFLSKTGFKFSEKSYAFALVDYADENFTSYDYIANLSIGYGRQFYNDKTTKLSGEIGFGLRRFQLKESAESQEEAVTRLAGNYQQKVSDNTTFAQELTFEFGKDFDVYKSVSQLSVSINSSMALSIGYEVQHTTEVEPGFENTDTKSTVNLVYNFL